MHIFLEKSKTATVEKKSNKKKELREIREKYYEQDSRAQEIKKFCMLIFLQKSTKTRVYL